MASVWFDGEVVMITQNAGREGDDHSKRFLLDTANYIKMVNYIQSLITPDIKNTTLEVVSLESDIPDLNKFYGDELDGFFYCDYSE